MSASIRSKSLRSAPVRLEDVPAHADVYEQPKADHHADQGGTSVAHQRERDAGDREQPAYHADILKHLPEDHRRYPDRYERPEAVAGIKGDAQRQEEDQRIQDEQGEAHHKSMFLRPDRE